MGSPKFSFNFQDLAKSMELGLAASIATFIVVQYPLFSSDVFSVDFVKFGHDFLQALVTGLFGGLLIASKQFLSDNTEQNTNNQAN